MVKPGTIQAEIILPIDVRAPVYYLVSMCILDNHDRVFIWIGSLHWLHMALKIVSSIIHAHLASQNNSATCGCRHERSILVGTIPRTERNTLAIDPPECKVELLPVAERSSCKFAALVNWNDHPIIIPVSTKSLLSNIVGEGLARSTESGRIPGIFGFD